MDADAADIVSGAVQAEYLRPEQATGGAVVLNTTDDDTDDAGAKRSRSGRQMGLKRVKSQDCILADVKRSQNTGTKLTKEVERGRDLLHLSYVRLEEADDRMEDKKLMSMLIPGSAQDKYVMDEYMKKREKVKKRKSDEELEALETAARS